MSETIYSELHDEQPRSTGAFELIKSLDRNVRELSDNLYDLKRDANSRLSRIDDDLSAAKKDLTDLKITTGVTQNELSSIKNDLKDLRRDLSDIKSCVRELSGGFSVIQTRFNWGLVILGIVVALIQFWKG